MLKMFRGRENGSRGGACRDSAQISRHLEKSDTEALLDELMELTEAAANGDVDLEIIDAYLNALDEKDPLPFEIDTEAALTDFHNKHGLLIKESRATHRRHLKTKRTASKIAAAIAIVCVTSSLVAEACGIDLARSRDGRAKYFILDRTKRRMPRWVTTRSKSGRRKNTIPFRMR